MKGVKEKRRVWARFLMKGGKKLKTNYFLSFPSPVPNVSFHVYAPSFFARFFESHAVMLQGNAGLKPKEGEITSRPWQWPINYKVSDAIHQVFYSSLTTWLVDGKIVQVNEKAECNFTHFLFSQFNSNEQAKSHFDAINCGATLNFSSRN